MTDTAPQAWPLGERQAIPKIYYDDDPDLVTKLRWIADQIEQKTNLATTEHPPWLAMKFNCCGGSPP